MGQINSLTLEGTVKSLPETLPNTTEKEFILRNRVDVLDANGKGTRIYSRIPIVIPDLPTHSEVAAAISMGATVKVIGKLIRRKRARTDGTTYLTTCVMGGHFEISITVPSQYPDENREEADDTFEEDEDNA